MHPNIFSSLKMKPVGASKFKLLSRKIEKNFYAELWLRLFETLVFFLKQAYAEYGNLEEFLKATQGTKLTMVIEANTNFPFVIEHLEKVWYGPLTSLDKKDMEAIKRLLREEKQQSKD